MIEITALTKLFGTFTAVRDLSSDFHQDEHSDKKEERKQERRDGRFH